MNFDSILAQTTLQEPTKGDHVQGSARSGPKWFENNSRNLFADTTDKHERRQELGSGWSWKGKWVSGWGHSWQVRAMCGCADDRPQSRSEPLKRRNICAHFTCHPCRTDFGEPFGAGSCIMMAPWKPATIRQKPSDANDGARVASIACHCQSVRVSERQRSFGVWALAGLSGFIILKLKCLSCPQPSALHVLLHLLPASVYELCVFWLHMCAVWWPSNCLWWLWAVGGMPPPAPLALGPATHFAFVLFAFGVGWQQMCTYTFLID